MNNINENKLNDALVTVIIPCYNYGRFINEAIDSILNQSIKDIRIIIIDAGSTDENTISILKNIHHEKIQVVFREGRHFVGSNRNLGISMSNSPYICCLDADDTLEPTYLEKAIFYIEYCGFDIVSTGLRTFGAEVGHYHPVRFPDLKIMMINNHIHTVSVFRRQVWQDAGEMIDFGVGKNHIPEDWEFWLRAVAHGFRAINLPKEYHMNYRIHPVESLSKSKDNPTLDEQRNYILNLNSKLLTQENILKSEVEKDLLIEKYAKFSEKNKLKSDISLMIIDTLVDINFKNKIQDLINDKVSKNMTIYAFVVSDESDLTYDIRKVNDLQNCYSFYLQSFLLDKKIYDFSKFIAKSHNIVEFEFQKSSNTKELVEYYEREFNFKNKELGI